MTWKDLKVYALKVACGLFCMFLMYILLHSSHTQSSVGPNLMAMLSRVCPVVGPQVTAYTRSMPCVSWLAITLSPAALIPISLLHSLWLNCRVLAALCSCICSQPHSYTLSCSSHGQTSGQCVHTLLTLCLQYSRDSQSGCTHSLVSSMLWLLRSRFHNPFNSRLVLLSPACFSNLLYIIPVEPI